MSWSQSIRNLKRTREIIQVLVKYGFEDLVSNSSLRNFVSEKNRIRWIRDEKPVLSYTRWERIRMACEELGPTFVKLAQIMSIRPDVVPEPLIKELEKLQDHVGPFPFKQVKEIIERETGKRIEDTFAFFDEKPLASASIGQVHLATLHDGEEVVVKVQRPGVRETVERDLAVIAEAARRAERYLKRQGVMNPNEIVRAFERSIMKELDYNNEARNIESFRKFYRKHKNFYVPKAFKEYTSEKVMVIEFAKGCKINDEKKLRKWGLNPKKIAENGMAVYLTQIFEFGYFHADPHPGNVLVKKDGTICLIDFGMVGRLMPKDKFAFANVFIAIAKKSPEEMALNLKRLATSHEIEDMRTLQYELSELIEDFSDLDVSEASINDMSASLQKIMYDHKIAVPGSVFLIFRAFAILEGIGKQIHPNFNSYEFMLPYGQKIFESNYNPETIFKEVSLSFEEGLSLWRTMPRGIKEIINKTRKGKLRIEVNHQGYGYLLKKLDILTNRLAFALIICALIIGSSITLLADFTPAQIGDYGVPKVTMAGYFIAGGLFVLLLYSIIRRKTFK